MPFLDFHLAARVDDVRVRHFFLSIDLCTEYDVAAPPVVGADHFTARTRLLPLPFALPVTFAGAPGFASVGVAAGGVVGAGVAAARGAKVTVALSGPVPAEFLAATVTS